MQSDCILSRPVAPASLLPPQSFTLKIQGQASPYHLSYNQQRCYATNARAHLQNPQLQDYSQDS